MKYFSLVGVVVCYLGVLIGMLASSYWTIGIAFVLMHVFLKLLEKYYVPQV